MRITIAKKMLLGYLAMVLFTVAVSIYAILSLKDLNLITRTILKEDFKIKALSIEIRDDLLAQERNEKKFLVLNDPLLEQLFGERSKGFKKRLGQLKEIPSLKGSTSLEEIELLYGEYMELFSKEVSLLKEGKNQEATYLSQGATKEKMSKLTENIRTLERNMDRALDEKMKLSNLKGERAIKTAFIISLLSLVVGISLALFITYTLSSPIRKLKAATQHIAQGEFDHDPEIKSRDEVGELADFFKIMGERLKKLEELSLDASPLTRLPGNVAIERALENRLKEKKPFALCHTDLDNFKAFADRYGYAWASEVIKEVAFILKGALNALRDQEGFLGHIGGDDFVIITLPPKADEICRRIIKDFDQRVPTFYSEKDREQGYIWGKDRQGIERKFPLMTISIAVVTNENRAFESPLEVAEVAAELKEYAKSLPRSNYVKEGKI